MTPVRDRYPLCFRQGQRAARDERHYSTNPYVRGSDMHLAWSQGHNEWRATMAYLREQLG